VGVEEVVVVELVVVVADLTAAGRTRELEQLVSRNAHASMRP
jgi:hypothetical protein